MLAALVREQTIDSKGLKKLADQASKDSDTYVRSFWTLHRIVLTLAAIEDIRKGYRSELFISVWFVPFVKYVRAREAGHVRLRGRVSALHRLHGFARKHRISLH